jgi:hypothetical protein
VLKGGRKMRFEKRVCDRKSRRSRMSRLITEGVRFFHRGRGELNSPTAKKRKNREVEGE